MAKSAPMTKAMAGTDPTKQPMYTSKASVAGKTSGQYGTGMVTDNKTYGPFKGAGRKVGRLGPDNASPKVYKPGPTISKGKNKGFTNEFSDQKGGSGRPVSGSQRGQ